MKTAEITCWSFINHNLRIASLFRVGLPIAKILTELHWRRLRLSKPKEPSISLDSLLAIPETTHAF